MPCELVEELVLGVGAFILILYEDDDVDDDELGSVLLVNFVFVLLILLLLQLLLFNECPVFVVDDTECCFCI